MITGLSVLGFFCMLDIFEEGNNSLLTRVVSAVWWSANLYETKGPHALLRLVHRKSQCSENAVEREPWTGNDRPGSWSRLLGRVSTSSLKGGSWVTIVYEVPPLITEFVLENIRGVGMGRKKKICENFRGAPFFTSMTPWRGNVNLVKVLLCKNYKWNICLL